MQNRDQLSAKKEASQKARFIKFKTLRSKKAKFELKITEKGSKNANVKRQNPRGHQPNSARNFKKLR